MEKFCPACSRVYGEDATACEVDGERLVLLSEEPSLVGHVLDGKYTLISKLGEGGMGSVYLAEQQTMGRQVAIKVLRREFSQNRMAIKRFLREARAASKLAHHNTITVYDFGQSNDGLLYLVMERLAGRPLADILDQDGALPPERAVHILAQICDSLSEAHKAGITHRDLKPENIFIEEKVGNPDFVKVLDFGIAKMQGDETTTQATAAGMICGTPSYMSPEQAMGKDIDGRSDIYALGVLLYEMLTNLKPFEGDTPMEVMLKHINEPSPDVFQRTGVQVPQGLQDALDRLLAKKVEKRPQDCQEAKKLIIAGLGTPLVGPVLSTAEVSPARKRRATDDRLQSLEKTGLSPAVSAPGPVMAVPARRTRTPWAWVAAAVVLIGVAALVIGLLAGSESGAASGPKETRVEPTPTEPTRPNAPKTSPSPVEAR
ncbi:MAG: serine/threonine protein kinase, partial [Deltaproteobacteria bacterium]|nr:serine/threonine protein kinase [Deltaproteobacteria bacterium]